MNRLDRLRAALACEPVDRPPYGFWTHLPGIDLDPVRLAEETAAFTRTFDLDFVKSMPNGFYMAQAWGCPVDFGDIARGGVARVTHPAVAHPTQWAQLPRLALEQPDLARELRHLAALVAAVGPDRPVLATVFSPLTTAAKLSGALAARHAIDHPGALQAGLDIITEVTCAFASAAIERGCAGIFLACQDAVSPAMDVARYRMVGQPGDLAVLAAARAAGSRFDVLHAHGEHILFDLLADYPVDALNWHIGETPPSIADYLAGTGPTRPRRAILGGLQRRHITARDRPLMEADLARSLTESGGRGLLLAPACVIRHPVDADTLHWLAARIAAGSAGLSADPR